MIILKLLLIFFQFINLKKLYLPNIKFKKNSLNEYLY